MSKQEVILCESLETSLGRAIELCPHDKLFVLTDEHTQRLCLPSLKESDLLKDAVEICIGAEDVHKTLETLSLRHRELTLIVIAHRESSLAFCDRIFDLDTCDIVYNNKE